MNEQEIKELVGDDFYNKINHRSKEQAKALLAAMTELQKCFKVKRFEVGYMNDDFIKDEHTLLIKIADK